MRNNVPQYINWSLLIKFFSLKTNGNKPKSKPTPSPLYSVIFLLLNTRLIKIRLIKTRFKVLKSPDNAPRSSINEKVDNMTNETEFFLKSAITP